MYLNVVYLKFFLFFSSANVFTNRDDALKLLKSHKDARFKAFQSKLEAEEFSLYGTLALNINITGLKSPSSLPIAAEKSLHRTLKPQELVAFRKEIEQNNLSNVYRMVMENPRYLVTAANTPTILKEGTRYNPLHVAIISKHLNMCKLILQTIEKPQFIELCNGPSQDTQSTQEASMILLESYLNMPDKPRSETPLHFAAKLGLKDIIELLISYPICKSKPNSEGMLPKDVSFSLKFEWRKNFTFFFSFTDHLPTCVWKSGTHQRDRKFIARTIFCANLACNGQYRATCHRRALQHQ